MPFLPPNQQRQSTEGKKHAFTNQRKCITTQNKHTQKFFFKLKPGLVAFYDIWPGNRAGLFSKEKVSKGGDKEKVKKKGQVGKHTI